VIPADRTDVLEAGLAALEGFAQRSGARGRFIALYLGLRRMGGGLAELGSGETTRSREIEQFMDRLLTKAHRAEPLVVLTAPFGGSTSPTAPYSTRTGEVAPGNRFATNTWRNNLSIQKGVGCPAEPETIRGLLANPALRLACPHMASDPEGQHLCTLEGTAYRGEEHSIWLRKTDEGWQKVDLDDPAAYGTYLAPGGERIPVFALIAVLYCDAPGDAYPERQIVGIPDFAVDFGFSVEQVEAIFDCDPGHPDNAAVLRAAEQRFVATAPLPAASPESAPAQPAAVERGPAPLPALSGPVLANSGLGAELAVAADLEAHGWQVAYRGRQTGVGYDLEAKHEDALLCVEVKSSVSFTTPELSESEWAAACQHGERFVLAIVDFYGSPQQAIWYVRDPAATATPSERTTTIYRLPRAALQEESTETDFL
jgi:hypothetical protein